MSIFIFLPENSFCKVDIIIFKRKLAFVIHYNILMLFFFIFETMLIKRKLNYLINTYVCIAHHSKNIFTLSHQANYTKTYKQHIKLIINITEERKMFSMQPASVAQLDARQTGDQEVASSIIAGSATFFRWDWSLKFFYGHSLPSADSRRAIVSFWRKNVHNTG